MQLPQQADYTSGASVVLVDYPTNPTQTITADAGGNAVATFDPVDNNFFWRIERITTYTDRAAPAGSTFLVYEGPQTDPTRIRDGSGSPALDIADSNSPITIHPNNQLVCQWTGLTPGTKASVSVQYQLWRRIVRGS